MLKPIYIICCELNLQDQASGLPSYINILEKVIFRKSAEPPLAMITPQMRVFAAWMGEAEDINQELEFETNILVSGSNRMVNVHKGRFICSGDGLIRLSAHLIGPSPVDGPGIMRIQNQIRRVDSEKWLIQEYPIIFEEALSPTATQLA